MPVSSALSRGLDLLSCFADAPVWLSNSVIASRTGLPAPTVARLTKSLTAMGLLHYSHSRRRFRLAPGIMRLGSSVRCEAHLVEMTRPQMQGFADRHRIHVSLVALDGTDGVNLEVCHSASTPVTLRIEAGSRVPVIANAGGHALLACLSGVERKGLIDALSRQHRGRWQRFEADMRHSLNDIEAVGYARCVGRWHPDVNGVAVPLRAATHGGALAISCAAAACSLPGERLDELGRELVLLAAGVSSDAARSTLFNRPDSGRPSQPSVAG